MGPESTLGAHLRRCREQSGLSIETVAERSRIVPRFVQALERDHHEMLPARVYVRGFIRAHCQETGASAEEALALYEAQVPVAGPVPLRPEPAPVPAAAVMPLAAGTGRRRLLVGAVVGVAGLGLVAGLLAVRAWRAPTLAGRPATAGPSTATAPAPPRPAVRPAPAEPAALVPPAPPTLVSEPVPVPAPEVPGAAAGPERVLVMRVVEATWVRVRDEETGARLGEETLAPGTVREWRSAGRFVISLGNAAGVEIQVDGRTIPPLGGSGQVVRDVTIPGEPKP